VREDLKGLTYRQMMLKLIGQDESYDIVLDTATYLKMETHSTVMKKFEWLGLFSDELLPDENNVMDMFGALLQKKLKMEKGDLDMIVLYHRFIAEYETKSEIITSTLVDIGKPDGDSAMSRTVSMPAAIAVAMILKNEINITGVHIPVVTQIYEPVLKELEGIGIKFIDRYKEIN